MKYLENIKKKTKYLTVLSAFICAIAGASERKSGPNGMTAISGVVMAANPVVGARIEIIDELGTTLANVPNATSKDGYFRIQVPENKININSTIQVTATGGSVGMENFKGSLVAIKLIKNKEHIFTHVNYGSYLVYSYMIEKPGTHFIDAQVRVKKYLGLPTTAKFNSLFEGRSYPLFSSRTFDNVAAGNGGRERFTTQLAKEMASDQKAKRTFRPSYLKLDVNDAITAVLKAAGGEIGSQVFSYLREGVGIPSDNENIFNSLTVLAGEIEKLQEKIESLDVKMTQLDFTNRDNALLKTFAKYDDAANMISELNGLLKANRNADGSIIDTDLQKSYLAQVEVQLQTVLALGFQMQNEVKIEVKPATSSSLGLVKIFNEFQYLNTTMIGKTYFENQQVLVNRYTALQALSTGLYIDAYKEKYGTSSGVALFNSKQGDIISYDKDDASNLPDAPLFKSTSNYWKDVRDNNKLYDHQTNLLWTLGYEGMNNCDEFRSRQQKGGIRSPGWNEIATFMNHTGTEGMTWGDAVTKIGFKNAETQAIVFGCDMIVMPGSYYYMVNWFGSDRSGPWDEYYDSVGRFESIAKGKLSDRPLYRVMSIETVK